jgi:hypothetical protein
LRPPSGCPPRIRTDASNPFAEHTLKVRVPAIVDRVIASNPDYPDAVKSALAALRNELATDAALPPLVSDAPGGPEFARAVAARAGQSWLGTDWFFAETYAYRCLIERVEFWRTGRDPFRPIKREEYAGAAHAEALLHALALEGTRQERLHALFGAALFGNRIDLSFAASLERGLGATDDDWIADDREEAVRIAFERPGPVHVICDNAGTELTLDLVLADFFLRELATEVVLHVKVHPTFVSDAITADVLDFLDLERAPFGPVPERARGCLVRLAAALKRGQLRVVSEPFWNGCESLWELPPALEARFAEARLVMLKGDANYRRALGDAIWAPETSFAHVTESFPAPLLALRTLKSDPLVGLKAGQAAELEALDPSFRVNGKRGLASLGGRLRS